MVKKKKKLMKVGMAGRNVTVDGKYDVTYGTTGTSYNRNVKSFKKRSSAVAYKNKLVKKFKPKYRVRYTYMSD
jgi:hypothetical protein